MYKLCVAFLVMMVNESPFYLCLMSGCARAYTMRMGGGAGNLKHLFEIAPRNIKVIFVVPHTPHHIEHKKLDGILCVLARYTSCRKNNSSVLPNGWKRKNGIHFKAES